MTKSNSSFSVIIIEDNPVVLKMLSNYLTVNGADVAAHADGRNILELIDTVRPDIVLFDVILPYIDGFSLLQKVREAGIDIPVIMLTERDTVDDKVLGLDLGADDYMTKPFSCRELLARIKSQLRRMQTLDQPQTITVGPLCIDPLVREVSIGEQESLTLTKTEFDLLFRLAREAPQVASHVELLRDVLGYKPDAETKALVMHIANVRRKLNGSSIAQQVQIKSVAGVGYKLVEQNSA